MNFAQTDLAILLPAFLAGALVLATHVPLGMRVLERGIVFIDLAIAQLAGLGAIAADLLGWGDGLALQASALAAALAGAILLTWTEKRWPRSQEALIGSLFVLAASGATLALANHPHGGEHLKDLLVGQILWVSRTQLVGAGLVALLVGMLLRLRRGRAGPMTFYLAFALSVTASVQLVGVYLVFASLILPALAVSGLRRRALAAAYAIGVLGYALGLLCAAAADLPGGPTVVLALALLALVFGLPRALVR